MYAVNNSNYSGPLIESRFIPYISWLILMSFVGTIGNLLIMISLIVNKKLRIISNVFVVNLAFADIFVTTVIDPFSVVAVFNEGEFFKSHSGLCVFLGAFVVTCCACSIWTIVAISLERYVHICHPVHYPKIFNRRTSPFILVCLWVIAAAIALPYFKVFGWGIYGYFPKGRICTCIFNVSYFYAWYLIGLELILPMMIIPYCYIRIYLLVRKSRRRLNRHSAVVSGRNWQDCDMRILKMVVTIWAVFMIMWSPYTANVLFDTTAAWPDVFFMTAVAFCLSNSSINFIIYGIMNENFREAYEVIFRKMLSSMRVNTVDYRDRDSIHSTKSVQMARNTSCSSFTVHGSLKNGNTSRNFNVPSNI